MNIARRLRSVRHGRNTGLCRISLWPSRYPEALRAVTWLHRCRTNLTTCSSRMSCTIHCRQGGLSARKTGHPRPRAADGRAARIRFCHSSSILRWSSVEGSPQGISLYEAQPPGPGIFRWHHLAGYANFSGGTTVPHALGASPRNGARGRVDLRPHGNAICIKLTLQRKAGRVSV